VTSKEKTGTTISLLLSFGLPLAAREPVLQAHPQVPPSVSSLQEENSAEPAAISGSVPGATIQILVVEDNAALRSFIREELTRQYRVAEAENGKQGYRQALETTPDIIICDVMMPEMDGITLCAALKTDERTSHIPLILLTAKADLESKLQGLETGADDYLTKPFKMEELQLRIRNLLESRRKLRERFSQQVTVNPKEITVTSTDERLLQKALAIMEANMANADFNVEVFSKEIGMSRAQLHRKLTALVGLSTNEFIRSLRLKRAASLLIQQQGNVSEVAYGVGFSSLNYFTKCFRDYYGQTPSEYARHQVPKGISKE
jgi:DNA-binding response OmpR family regulator